MSALSASAPQSPSKPHIATHILAGLLALAFLAAGGNKLTGPAEMLAGFDAMGLPSWFLYVTGAVEVAGAILIALPLTRLLGAAILTATMLGAVAAHAANAHPFDQWIAALVLLSLSALSAWTQRAMIPILLKRFGLRA